MLSMLLDPYSFPFWIIIISIIAGAIAVTIRPFSSYIKFVYPNAKYEAIGNPFITDKELNNLVESDSPDDFKENLNSLRDFNIEGKNSSEIQASLDNHFLQTIQMMKKDNSKKMQGFFDVYLEKNDFYLIKKELKNKIVNNEVNNKSIEKSQFIHNKKLLSEIKDSPIEDVPKILIDYGFSGKIKEEILKDDNDFLMIDKWLDTFYIEKFSKVKIPYKCETGRKRFIQIFTDLNNIKNVLRAKQMGYKKEECMKLFLGEGIEIAKWKFEEIADSDSVSQAISSLEGTSYYDVLKNNIDEYNKTQSVQILENSMDNLYLKHIKDLSQENYITIGPTIRFLVSKEFEIRNLKIIAKGLTEKITPEFIKSLLIKEAHI